MKSDNFSKKLVVALALFAVQVFSQNSFTDNRDGKKYKAVKIGEQVWMAENLNYAGEDGYLGLCYGDKPKEKIRNPDNCSKYGRLYDWSEAMGLDRMFNNKRWGGKDEKHRGICPVGWHLPNYDEFKVLVNFAGGSETAGQKLKSKSSWINQENCKRTERKEDDRGRITVIEHDDCASDVYGFSAIPGGFGGDGFDSMGSVGIWWSSSEREAVEDLHRQVMSSGGGGLGLGCNHNKVIWQIFGKTALFSIRCIQD